MTIYFTYSIDPDIYYDTEGLTGTVQINVPIAITNGEDVTLWFKAELVNPPVGYTLISENLGSLTSGSSGWYIFNFQRTIPSLTDGEFDEALTIRVTAYTDAGYSVVYGYADSATTIHFFNSYDPAWTLLYNDTFEGGVYTGYSIYSGAGYQVDPTSPSDIMNISIVSDHFLSAPYALGVITTGSAGSIKRTFVVGAYTKARLIMHFREEGSLDKRCIKVGSILYLPVVVAVLLPSNKWLRVCFPLPVNASTDLLFFLTRVDNVRVIVK